MARSSLLFHINISISFVVQEVRVFALYITNTCFRSEYKMLKEW